MDKSDFDDAVMLDTGKPMLDKFEWTDKCDECGNILVHKNGCSKNNMKEVIREK